MPKLEVEKLGFLVQMAQRSMPWANNLVVERLNSREYHGKPSPHIFSVIRGGDEARDRTVESQDFQYKWPSSLDTRLLCESPAFESQGVLMKIKAEYFVLLIGVLFVGPIGLCAICLTMCNLFYCVQSVFSPFLHDLNTVAVPSLHLQATNSTTSVQFHSILFQ